MTVIDNRVRRIDNHTTAEGCAIISLGIVAILLLGLAIWYAAYVAGKTHPDSALAPYANPVGAIAMLFIHWKGIDLYARYWFNEGVPKLSALGWKFMICFWTIELIVRLMNQFCPQVLPECLQEDVHVSQVQVVIEDHTQNK